MPVLNARRAGRAPRDDGDTTRARLLEAAGQLFAERGYADTTSKTICLRAKSNPSAVNYHFGSRDALYMAVLEIAHTHMMSLDFLMQLAGSPVSPREKIEQLVDGLILNLRNPRGWQLRLWAREIIFPTPLFAAGVARNVMPKVGIVHALLGQYMQLPADSPAVHCGVVSLMAPCMGLLIADRDLKDSLIPALRLPPEELARNIKIFLFTGLNGCIEAAQKEHDASATRPAGPSAAL